MLVYQHERNELFLFNQSRWISPLNWLNILVWVNAWNWQGIKSKTVKPRDCWNWLTSSLMCQTSHWVNLEYRNNSSKIICFFQNHYDSILQNMLLSIKLEIDTHSVISHPLCTLFINCCRNTFGVKNVNNKSIDILISIS